MFKLSLITSEEIDGGINLVDLGASGSVPSYWKPLSHLTNLIGFDPNGDECERLNRKKSGFLSHRFLPFAIASNNDEHTLYKTQSIYCWSLLQPNLPWLRRFTYSNLFEVKDTEKIFTKKLEDIDELKDLDIDAIKLDTQGLELPILKSSERIIKDCIYLETETGFSDNYIGETTFGQIADYIRELGFELFDINPFHRVARKNNFSKKTSHEQILWCEAIWLRDYCKGEDRIDDKLTRAKALKALCLYANHGCVAFGLEAAEKFKKLNLITNSEFEDLKNSVDSWRVKSDGIADLVAQILKGGLNFLPRRFYGVLLKQIMELANTQHPLSKVLKRSD